MVASKKSATPNVVNTAISLIKVDENARKNFDKASLKELTNNIKQYGILEPLIVREVDGKVHLVAGERRLRAAKAAGLNHVPTIAKELTDDQVLEMQLIENLQREDLAPMEEAQGVTALLARGLSQRDVAKMLGKSEGWVSARARMADLPPETRKLIDQGKLGVEQAVMLLPYKDYPIINVMEKNLVDELQWKGSAGPKCVKEEVIADALRNPSYARDLDNFGQGYMDDGKRLKAAFDTKPCMKCNERIEVPDRWDEKRKRHVCLKKECWAKKLKEARKQVRASKKASKERKEKKGELTTNDLHWYSELKDDTFDKTECQKCDKAKKVKHWDGKMVRVCTNQACHQKKEKQQEKIVRDYANMLRNTVGVHLAKVTEPTLREGERRLLLQLQIEGTHNDDIIKAALGPWVDRKPKKGWVVAARTMPEHALLPALFRLTLLDSMTSLKWNPEAADKLKNKLEPLTPLLLEGFDPKKVKDDAKKAVADQDDEDLDDEDLAEMMEDDDEEE